MEKNPSLIDVILRIVDEHSGGMKIIELLTELIAYHYSQPEGAFPDFPTPNIVEEACRQCPELGVLTYAMVMGDVSIGHGAIREKMFVYRPLPS